VTKLLPTGSNDQTRIVPRHHVWTFPIQYKWCVFIGHMS
jgi:hypothetical protein